MTPHAVAVAMSGGIDSLVAAYLLQSAGHRIIGIHFLTGYETRDRCPATDAERARTRLAPIAERLGIRMHILDVAHAFESHVVSYFTRAYRAGQTPNPCLRCNPQIKFGVVAQAAHRLGARHLATGHYARVVPDRDGGHHLLKGVDSAKDQSYFLAFMTPAQLAGALFPLGDRTKEAVRRLAVQHGLTAADGEESQDICFIRRRAYGDFLADRPDFQARPGPIEDTSGRIIGSHGGLHLFTVGQRRGINCPARQPYYVLGLDPARNRLIVGFRAELDRDECEVRDVNWLRPPRGDTFKAEVRLRYRHRPVACEVTLQAGASARLRFGHPQAAVTPGQGAVLYDGDEVLGAGWIL